MTETPDFIKQLREPAASTAKENRETNQNKSDYIKQNFTSEAYGWDSLFNTKEKERLMQLVSTVSTNNFVSTNDSKEIQKNRASCDIRDVLSEFVVNTNGLTGPEFYEVLITAVKYEYEYYNTQATKLKKILDLMTPNIE